MKNSLRIISLIAVLLSSIGAYSQGGSRSHILYDQNTGWFIGLNGGATYQNKKLGEVDRYAGFGWGLTFGKDWLKKDKFLGWGLRYRFLMGTTYGLDAKADTVNLHQMSAFNGGNPSLDYSNNEGIMLHNYRNRIVDNSLELSIHLNRLRQNTGIILSGFGGVDLTAYSAKTNQLDDFGNRYIADPEVDYGIGELNGFGGELLDGTFESDAAYNDGPQVRVMPTLGFEAGFQLSPRAALTFTHRHTWTLTNGFDGQIYDREGNDTRKGDGFFYTGLSITWNLHRGRAHVDPINNTNNNNTNNNYTYTPPKKKPIVNITDPYSNPHNVTSPNFNLKANIFNVDGAHQITFKQDGNTNYNFTYYPATNSFSSNVILHPGQNVFEIRATNEAGSDYESRVIVYSDPVIVSEPAPIVSITNPANCPKVVSSSMFNVTANIFNVEIASNVQFKINGVNKGGFNFNPVTNSFNATLTLQEGNNVIQIVGTNSVGSDSKTCNIIYEQPVQTFNPPTVNIYNPGLNPYTTNNSTQTVNASVTNISSASQITVSVNGVNVNNFSFSGNTVTVNTNLNPGNNYVTITGTNNDGVASDATTIIYNQPNIVQPPVVTYTNPTINPLTVYNSQYTLTAQVLNVSSANNINVTVNGVNTNSFTYSTSSKVLTLPSSLIPGANVFQITATNSAGSDYASTTIIYNQPAPQLPPVVTITSPTVNPYTVNIAQATVLATVLNVNSANDITVQVNGQNTNNFAYNNNTKQVTINKNLVLGNNVFSITGTNSYGSDNASTTIIFEELQQPQPPTVNISSPSTNPYTSTVTHQTVIANVTNVSSASQIDVTINGSGTNNFSFNGSNTVTIPSIALVQGNNNISVTATNPDGVASDNVNIIYAPVQTPCDKPTIAISQPSVSPFNFVNANGSYTVVATVNHVSNLNQVTAKLNGVGLGGVSLNGNQLSIPVTLQAGNNVIEIDVDNNCDIAHASAIITYNEEKPCDPPSVSINSPQNGFTTQNASTTLNAQVMNVSIQSDIQLTVNGQNQSFSFDVATHTLTANINLSVGPNVIEITGTNECGKDVKNISINREACNAPVISITSPSNNGSSPSQSVVLSATVTNVNNSSDITVKVDGNAVGFNYNNGIVTSTLNLNVGVHNIEISAQNNCGNNSQSIEYTREDCPVPTINMVKPATNPFATSDNNLQVTAYVTGASQNDITVLLNGNSHSFQFGAGNGKIIFVNTLQEGNNVLEIKVNTPCGVASTSTTVIYTKEEEVVIVPAPVVNITNPAINPHISSTSTYTVQGTVTNISSASDMSVTIDGANVSNFTYSNGQFSVPVSGINSLATTTVVVTATNSAGSDSDNTGLKMLGATGVGGGGKPGDNGGGNSGGITIGGNNNTNKPTVNLTSPNPSATTSSNTYNITGTVNGVSSQSQVQLTVNGAVQSNFSFNSNTGAVSLNYNITDSLSTVVLSATNSAGTMADQGVIIYQNNSSSNSGGISGNSGNGGNNGNGNGNGNSGGNGGNGNGNGNNGHGNNDDGVDSSNPGQGGGGPNGTDDPSGNDDDEGANGNQGSGNGNSGNAGNGSGGNGGSNQAAPVINMINPSNANESTTALSYNISGSITNVNSSDDISIILNNSEISTFSFDPSTGVFQFMAMLNSGNNIVTIEAENQNGSDSETISILSNSGSGSIGSGNGNGGNGNGNSGGISGGNGNGSGNSGNGNGGGNGASGMILNNDPDNNDGNATQLNNEEAENEKKFQALIEEADNAFARKDYATAKTKYQSANQLKSGGYAQDQLNKITNIEKKEAAEKAAAEKKRQEEEARRKAEEARKRQEAEARAKAEADRKRQEEEARRKAEEARKQQEAEARAKAEADKKRQEEEARRKAEEARKQQEANAKANAEAEKKRQEEEARRKAEEARKRQEAEARAKAEADRKRQEEEARRNAEEARKRQEAEARAKAEEARKRQEAEARARAEADRKRKEEEARRKAEEARKRQEAERKRKEAEAKARAEAERKKKEAAAKAKAEAAAKAEAEAEKKKAEEAKKSTNSRSAGGR